MKSLVIGKDGFSLPSSLIVSTQAILARKRSGKSYTASVMAEEMLKQKQQILVIDPTDAWSGLRSSADGKSEGYPVVVFGGRRADAPLDFRAGTSMAMAVVKHGFSAIFSLGGMKTKEQIFFVHEFCSELLRINEQAIHLFMDEADTFAPQKPNVPGQAECLGAVSRLVKQGGIAGIGFTMITQRSASISWDVLSQVDILTVLRMSAPHDTRPVFDWMISEATPEFAAQVKREQPGLPIGTAFIASAPLNLAVKIQIRQRETFNSGATPKPGERIQPPTALAQVDIQKLGQQIAATIEEDRANSPTALKAKIRELEAKIAEAGKNTLSTEREQMLLEQIETLTKTANTYDLVMSRVYAQSGEIIDCMNGIRQEIEMARGDGNTIPAKPGAVPKEIPGETLAAEDFSAVTSEIWKPTPKAIKELAKSTGENKLRSGAERMLAACAQWYPHGRSEAQIASQVGMKRTGGTWAAYKSDLRKGGYITIENGRWFATEGGVRSLGADVPKAPTTTREMVELWESNLRSGAVAMLKALISHRGKPISRDELGTAVNMEPRGGTFSAYLSDLKSAELIVVEGSTVRANKETLFL